MNTPKRDPERERKLRLVGQSHLNPGMSLAKWHEIVLKKYGISARATGDAWAKISDTTLDAIIADLQAVTGGQEAQ